MSNWEDFEQKCCSYLNENYGSKDIRFELNGGSDSTAPDIKVCINGVNVFNMEVKSGVAQSGQFVVLNENGRLVFSPRNRSKECYAKPFIDYMNDHYNLYNTPTTASEELDMDPDVYNNWIINHYKHKKAKFVITGDSPAFIIFPIEHYGSYFETKCNYRIKGSGTGSVAKRDAEAVKTLFHATSYRFEPNGKKKYYYYYLSGCSGYKHADTETLGEYTYYVSRVCDSGEIRITRKSNTRNANVIFSIKLKKNQSHDDIELFKKALK